MKTISKISKMMMIALAIATVSSSFAQRGGGGGQGQGGPGGGGPGMGQRGPKQGNSGMMLIKMSTVQQELHLTAAQIEAVNALRPPQGGPGGGGPGGGGGQGGNGGGGPRGGGQGGPRGGGPGGGGQGGPPPEDGGPLKDILNETQLARLKQLDLQFNMPMSIMDPRSGRTLELTEAQRDSIDQIIRTEMPRPDREERPTWAQQQAAKARATTRVLAVLTSEQKTAWNRIIGAAFSRWEEPRRPGN